MPVSFSEPVVSVIMPVFNGAEFLDRAFGSLVRQTLQNWEAIGIDDASTDATSQILEKWAKADPRIRVFRNPENRGLSGTRNRALVAARANWIAYLDHDDEFYPDHLARANSHYDKGDVLLFQYDLVEERAGHPNHGRIYTHDPSKRFHAMFTESISVPLGVVHRRELLARAGYFDETLGRYQGQDEDADLWQRFSKAGAKFAAVAAKSGLYHIRSDSLSRARSPAPQPTGALTEVDVVRGSVKHTLTMPASDAWIVDQIFREGEYAGVPLDKLRRPPIILDIGAHCGAFALYAKLTLHREATIHCFEPYLSHVELLQKNLASFSNITFHAFGLGRADTTAELLLDPKGGVGNSTVPQLVPKPAGLVPVSIRDVRAVWDECGFAEIDILKIDAEGAEVEILERLGDRLARVRVVLVEYHTQADRRRVDALLPGHDLFGAAIHSTRIGTLKYLSADLSSRGP